MRPPVGFKMPAKKNKNFKLTPGVYKVSIGKYFINLLRCCSSYSREGKPEYVTMVLTVVLFIHIHVYTPDTQSINWSAKDVSQSRIRSP